MPALGGSRQPLVVLSVPREDTSDTYGCAGKFMRRREGLEAGVGAEGVEEKPSIEKGHLFRD